ncbi:hypothetical protein V6N12_032944 [Hibiscus sabdariffa]|uniref:DUF4283 domain-containing protein n=1 Tax=Hibiscus sabdariffa TaxID=183260 RepID=A0ABR2BEW7_9ROSI
MAWIRLFGLPLTLYKRNFIEAICNQIGSIIKIDFQTDNGFRGHFAHLACAFTVALMATSRTSSQSFRIKMLLTLRTWIPCHLLRCLSIQLRKRILGHGCLLKKRKHNPIINDANHVNHAPKESRPIPPITNLMFDESDNFQDSLQESREHVTIPAPTSNIHHASQVSLQDGDNPGLSKKSATGDQSRQGQEAMVD